MRLTIKGIFKMTVYREGKQPEVIVKNNLVVANGLNKCVALLANSGTDNFIKQIAAGTNGATPAPEDITITDAFLKDLSSSAFPETGKVSFAWSIENFENNGMEIQEFGLMCNDGSLFARIKHNPIEKDSSMRIVGEWDIIIST